MLITRTGQSAGFDRALALVLVLAFLFLLSTSAQEISCAFYCGWLRRLFEIVQNNKNANQTGLVTKEERGCQRGRHIPLEP